MVNLWVDPRKWILRPFSQAVLVFGLPGILPEHSSLAPEPLFPHKIPRTMFHTSRPENVGSVQKNRVGIQKVWIKVWIDSKELKIATN